MSTLIELLDEKGRAIVDMDAKVFLDESCDPYSRQRFIAKVYYLKIDSRYYRLFRQKGKNRLTPLELSGLAYDSRLVDAKMPVIDDKAKLIKGSRTLRLEPFKPYYLNSCLVDEDVPDEQIKTIKRLASKRAYRQRNRQMAK